MKRLLGWMRVGLMDLRGDLRRFGVLIACLALGTSVIAAVGSVGTALKKAVDRDAIILMGGDFEASRPDRDATPEELAFLQSLGEVTHVVDTNGRGATDLDSALVDILAIDEAYPLRGNVVSPVLQDGEKPAGMLGREDGLYGALLDPVLYDKLSIQPGDIFRIGQTELEVRGSLLSVPDGALRGFQLGATVMISTEAIALMTDLRPPLPGLLTQRRYKVVLENTTYEEAAPAFLERFGDGVWQTRSPREAAGELVVYYDLFQRFLIIVGLSSLLVGGVGVSNGVTAHIAERIRSIATLRSLGATGARIMVHFLTQVGLLAAVGVVIGLFLGALGSIIVLPIVGQALNVNLPPSIEPVPLMTAGGFGLLSGFAYSYLPLVKAQKVSPAMLFRASGGALDRLGFRVLLSPKVLFPLLLAAAGIFWLAVLTTNDVELVAYYAVGVVGAYLLLRGAAWILQTGMRRLPKPAMSAIRHAMRNIHAPGSTAPIAIISIGLGLAMLLIITLLESNLHKQLLGQVTKDAPTFVATDLFDDEAETIEEMAATGTDIVKFNWGPMLRAAITEVNGIDSAAFIDPKQEASILFTGEIPITWARDLPEGTEAIDGEWWPADYDSDDALISLRHTVRNELGLKIGDTMTFRMFGEDIVATIANFREYQWQSGLNFMVTFSPGIIQDFPSTYLGTIKAAEGREKDVERALLREFPDISFIPVGDALDQISRVLSQLGTAVNVVGALAVVNGLLVLAGTMAAGRKQRESDAVVQKVLGATRRNVLSVFVVEYGLLGAFAAIVASAVGILSAWLITVSSMEVPFYPDPVLIGIVVLGAIILTVAAGAATTWRALSTPPSRYLRSIG